jgi:hypothetical protein
VTEHRSARTAKRSSGGPAEKPRRKSSAKAAQPPTQARKGAANEREVAKGATGKPAAKRPAARTKAAPTAAGSKKSAERAASAKGASTRRAVARPGVSRAAEVDRRKRILATERRQPDPRALKLAADVGSRRDAACNFRKAFARRADAASPPPLLARLVGAGAGRAAEPRVKIALTLLYLARDDDKWTVDGVPAATWALLFGLHDPEKLGAARVTAAIRALNHAGVIKAEQRRGREPRVLVRHETGADRPWTSPVGEKGKQHAEEDYYAQLDRGFWANGWISVLSARAIAALVILLDATWDQRGTDKVPEEVRDGLVVGRTKALRWWHITEEQLTGHYAVSRDLFDRGVKELMDWQLVEARKRGVVERTTWGDRRWYRELRVRLEVLAASVADIALGKEVPRVGHSSELPVVVE